MMPNRTKARSDEAVSAVIGTILMVAITVMVAATLFTVVGGFGTESVVEPPRAVFKAQALDTDSDGKTDGLRVSYVSGNTLDGVTRVSAKFSNGTEAKNAANGNSLAWPAAWAPGDFSYFNTWPGTILVTITVSEVTVLDQSVTVQE